MRQVVTIAAALAMIGVSGDLASAQGQGQGQNKDQGESKVQGQKGDNGAGRDRAGNGPKENRDAQTSRPTSADRSPRSSETPAGSGKEGRKASEAQDRERENGNANARRDARQDIRSNRGAASPGNGNSAMDRSKDRAAHRESPSDNADRRARAANNFIDDRRARENRKDAQRNSRRGDVRDQTISRRITGDRPQFAFVQSNYLIEGCPPGLAKKNNGCTPPGQDRQRSLLNYGADFFGYRNLQDGRYRYGDGYLYRLSDSGGLLGFIPLLGGALSIGNIWPQSYRRNQVPDYYAEYYNLGPPRNYGYADDVIYRLNPQSSAITSIAALLTGDEFRVGERAPDGYEINNVPTAYRDDYRDRPDADYRYSDGYVYEIDPTTQLVRAAIELLA